LPVGWLWLIIIPDAKLLSATDSTTLMSIVVELIPPILSR